MKRKRKGKRGGEGGRGEECEREGENKSIKVEVPQRLIILCFFTAVTIGFVQESIIVNETDMTARLIVRVLQGTLAGDASALIRFFTTDDSAQCTQLLSLQVLVLHHY